MDKDLRILFVFDTSEYVLLLADHIRAAGYKIDYQRVETIEDYEHEAKKNYWDLILSDYTLPNYNALSAVELLYQNNLNIPLILIADSIGEVKVAEIMKAGAEDFIHKNDISRLIPTIKSSMEKINTHTDIKKLKYELKSTEKKFKIIFESAPLAFIIWDTKARITAWNDMAEVIFGYSEEEALGKSVINLIVNPARKSDVEQIMSNLTKDIIRSNTLLPNITKDGRQIWCEWNNSVLHDENGNVTAFLSTAMDVTEKINTQKKLYESELRFHSFMNHIPAGIYMKDSAGKYLFLNKYNEENFGVDDWHGKSSYDLFDHEIAKKFSLEDKITLEKGFYISEDKVKNKKGEEKYYRTNQFIINYEREDKLIGGISIDITQEKQAELALIESERQISTLLSNLPGMAYRCLDDKYWTMKFVSDGCKRLTGYEPNELLDNNIISYSELILDDDKESIVNNNTNDPQLYKTFELTYRIRTKNGDIKWVWERGVRTSRENGSYYLEGIIEDISERKQAEQALKESEHRYKTLVETNPEGIVVHREGRIILANPAAARILKAKDENELIGKSLLDFVHPDHKEIAEERIVRKQAGKLEGIVEKFVDLKGNVIDVEISGSKFMSGGKISSLIVFHDITDRKLAEQKLKESEYRYRTLFETAFDGIMILSENQFVDCNRATLHLFGCKQHSDFLGHTPWEFSPELQPDGQTSKIKAAELIDAALEGKPLQFRWRHVKKDGSPFDTEVSLNKLTLKDGRYLQAIVRDITKLVQAETALKESEEKFRTLFEKLIQGVVIQDDSLNIIQANQAALDYLGLTYEQITGKSSFDPDWRAIHEDGSAFPGEDHPIAVAIKTGKTVENVIMGVYNPRTKSHRWLRVDAGPLFMDEEAKPQLAYALFDDITEQREAEINLRISEEKYRLIFENAQVGIYRTRLSDGKLIMANQRMADLFGYKTIEDALKYYITSEHYVEESAREGILKLLRKYGRFDNYEAALTTHDGKVRWYQYSGRLFKKEGYIEGVAIDITERKEYELELKRRNIFIQTVLDNLPLGIALNEISSGTATYVNKKFEEIYGWSAHEMNSIESFFEKVYPDKKYREEVISRIMSDIASGDPSRMRWDNILVTHKDKSKRIVRAQNIPLFEQNTMVSTVMDVTAQKEAEKLLRESEEKYRMLIENQTDLVVKVDNNGRFEFVSRSYCELFGKHENQLLGKKFMPLVHPEDQKRTEKEMKKLSQPPYKCYLEQRAKTTKGWRWLAWSDKAILDEKKRVASIIGVGRDITEKKLAEIQILQERNKAKNYLETASLMMLALDTKGNVTLINKKGAEILGYSKKYIIGKNWFDTFLIAEDKPKVKKIFNKIMKGLNYKHEYGVTPVRCRYGRIKVIGWHNNILRDEDGNISGTLSSGEDITEKLKLQNDLETSNAELSRLTKHLQRIREEERSRLARELHDDLGQALTALKLDLTQVRKNIDPNDWQLHKKVNSALNLAGETVKTVQKITSDLRPGMIDDLGLIPTIQWYVDEFAQRSNIKVGINIDMEESDINEEYKISFYRIIQEALTNVARHARATKVSIRFSKRSDKLILLIRDNGVGIQENQIRKPQSFGMIGMKERILLAGGQFEVSGKKNKGTRIKVSIPIKSKKPHHNFG